MMGMWNCFDITPPVFMSASIAHQQLKPPAAVERQCALGGDKDIRNIAFFS